MLISHKRKVAKKNSKWRPFFIETFVGEILTHDLNQTFPKEITSKLASGELASIKKMLSSWKADINSDTSVISLRNTYPNVTDYLCAQVHLLNILCRNNGFRHLRYKKPFLQLYTGSVKDKIETNIAAQPSFSKGNSEPFKHLPLKGYNKSHFELFPYSRNQMFNDYTNENGVKVQNRTDLINKAKKSYEKGEFLTIEGAVKHHMEEKEQKVFKIKSNKVGKITGFWLISKKVNGIEKYICITPHGNKRFNDKCIKSVIDTAENFSI